MGVFALLMDYLKFYASWNAIAYSRGHIPNFMSFEPTKLHNMLNLNVVGGRTHLERSQRTMPLKKLCSYIKY